MKKLLDFTRTPASVVDQSLAELESIAVKRLERDWDGQDVITAIRRYRVLLRERLASARWKRI